MKALTYQGSKNKMGRTHAQRYTPELLEHIGNGKMNSEVIITHRLRLDEAVCGYKIFDKREEDCRKVILTP